MQLTISTCRKPRIRGCLNLEKPRPPDAGAVWGLGCSTITPAHFHTVVRVGVAVTSVIQS